MQARLVSLLLRYDEAGFGRQIGVRAGHGAGRKDAALQRYRDLGAVFALRDELFEDIVPRIVRRLSFRSPRRLVVEEPPARGGSTGSAAPMRPGPSAPARRRCCSTPGSAGATLRPPRTCWPS